MRSMRTWIVATFAAVSLAFAGACAEKPGKKKEDPKAAKDKKGDKKDDKKKAEEKE